MDGIEHAIVAAYASGNDRAGADSYANSQGMAVECVLADTGHQLSRGNEWLRSHQERLTDIADRIGPRLVKVYDGIGAAAPGAASGALAVGAGAVGARGAVALAGTGPIGLAIGAVVGAVIGGVTLALTSAARRFPGVAARIGSAVLQIGDAVTQLGSALSEATDNPFLQAAGAILGELITRVLLGLTTMIRAFTLSVQLINGLSHSAAASAMALASVAQGDAGAAAGFRAASVQIRAETFRQTREGLRNLVGFRHLFEAPDRPGEGDRPTSDNNFNFHGPITVTIQAERLDDPNVVAVSFRQAFGQAMEHPTTSRRTRKKPKPL